ncbi:MAG: molecular chaperone DnaK [Myxococcales bacterium]|nr:molecular chaperone DnaK [Myxococcales bacterium]
MSTIIGIDLGTTNSVVAALVNGEPVVLPNREGSRTTPSIVGFTETGERFVGHQAKRQAVINPERTIFACKRLMGRKFKAPEVQDYGNQVPYKLIENANGEVWISLDGENYSPQEISAYILEKMKSTAEDYFGEEITQAVVTVPAYFDDAQRQATKEAGRLAGLEIKRIINEPTAAALAYGLNRKDDAHVAVFDLGGGTFDISIVHINNGVFEVLATCGDNTLGGEDFDQILLQHLVEKFLDETGIDVSGDKMAVQRLKEAAENAKCELSTLSETNINLPFLAVDDTGPKHLNTTLTRSQLNSLVSHLVDRLEHPCQAALEDAGTSVSGLDEVLLVGGMTRMPIVRDKVEEIFGMTPQRSVNPDEIVAVGAAIQSGILGGEVKEVVLLDVTPLSLGIRVVGNRLSKVILRNTPIPTLEKKIFTTTEDNQELVSISVLQGEADDADDCKLLGMFNLTGIPPADAGVPRIEVAFQIDTDGILHVSAQDVKTMKSQSVVITNAFGLSSNEFQQAQERIAKG